MKTSFQKGFINIGVVIGILIAVAVSGYLVFVRNMRVAVVPTLTVSPSISASPVTDGTASWKTYTNTKYGFEFKYPSEFSVVEYGGSSRGGIEYSNLHSIIIIPPGYSDGMEYLVVDYYVDLANLTQKSNLSLEQFLNKDVGGSKNYYDINRVSINGNPAYSAIEVGLVGQYKIFIEHGSHVYQIETNVENSENLDVNQKLILSTFKFTK